MVKYHGTICGNRWLAIGHEGLIYLLLELARVGLKRIDLACVG